MADQDDRFVIQNTNISKSNITNIISIHPSTAQFDATKICEGTGRVQRNFM